MVSYVERGQPLAEMVYSGQRHKARNPPSSKIHTQGHSRMIVTASLIARSCMTLATCVMTAVC